MDEYLNGDKLFGDDFPVEDIAKWYEQEAEGYSNLVGTYESGYFYAYHSLNFQHGYRYLKHAGNFDNVLGFGSAMGNEFEPIIHRIKKLTIIEPSNRLRNERIGDVTPIYVKPDISGSLRFDPDSFDLITCFGTLHHIPNVTYVLNELVRVLKPNGFLLIREPITSMGDWRSPRTGLTKNERGIPVKIFEKILNDDRVEIISKSYCFTMTPFFQRLFSLVFKNKTIFSNKCYVMADKYLSLLLSWNVHYNPVNIFQRCAPGNIFFVIRKKTQIQGSS